jgi:hypothetical protein
MKERYYLIAPDTRTIPAKHQPDAISGSFLDNSPGLLTFEVHITKIRCD